MTGWKWWGAWALEVVAIAFIVTVVIGHLLGQPVLLGFVTSGSMAPTLEIGDGYVAIPSDVAGSVEEGDVIVFQAEELHGGGLTTHRVVEVTDRGFVTKGDANPFTDQDNDEPPVKRAQVVATVWQPGAAVLAIPHVGTVVTGSKAVIQAVQRRLAVAFGTRSLLGAQGLAYILLGLLVGAYLLDLWLGRGTQRRQKRERSRNRGTSTRLLMAGFAGLVVLSVTGAMTVPAGPQKFGIVSAEFQSPGPQVIPVGESESMTYPVPNGGILPVVTYLEPASDGIDVNQREVTVPPRSVVNATVTLHAPPKTGYYRRFLVEHRYLAILPESTIRALYRLHPWAPIVAIDALLGVPFYLVGVRLVGTGRLRSRSRAGPSVRYRLLRWLS